MSENTAEKSAPGSDIQHAHYKDGSRQGGSKRHQLMDIRAPVLKPKPVVKGGASILAVAATKM